MENSNLIATMRLFGEEECWKVNILRQLKGFLAKTIGYMSSLKNSRDGEDYIKVFNILKIIKWFEYEIA